MLHVLSHAASLAALALLAWSAGWGVERYAFAGADLGGLRALARWVLGLGAWIGALFALAAAGLLNRLGVLAVTALVLLLVVRLRRREPPTGDRAAPQALASRFRLSGPSILGALLLGALLVPLFGLVLGPTISWDADVYHLTLPRLYLEAGGFREVPFSVYSNWPLGIELLYALALLVEDYVLAKLVHFGFGLLLLWAAFGAASRAAGSRPGAGPGGDGGVPPAAALAGWLAVAFLLINDVFVFELRVAYVELGYAFFFVAGFLFLSAAAGARRGDAAPGGGAPPAAADARLLLAGICAGLVASTKVTGILGAAVLGALWLPVLGHAARRRTLGREARHFGLRFALPVLACWLPWLVKAGWYTGNPFYPFAYRLFDGAYWSGELGAQLAAWQRSIGMGREPLDYLLLLPRVILRGGRGYDHFDGALSPLWLLLLPLALTAVRRRPLVRRALAASGLYFLLWAMSAQQMRFLVPTLPLLALAAAVAAADLVARLRRGALRRLLAAVLVAAGLLHAGLGQLRVLAAGTRSFAVYRAVAPQELVRRATPPVFAFANDRLPKSARILMLNTNRGFFCRREYLADSFFEASQIRHWLAPAGDDVTALKQRLDEAGISHLLWSARDWGIPWPPALHALLADPTRARPLYRDREYILYALR